MKRRNLGPVYDNEKENWRILTNKEMYANVIKPTITETIRLGWFGNVQRMEENKKIEFPKILYMNLETRLRGRPRSKWQDEVREVGRLVREEGGRKGYITEEWKKLLSTTRNHHILHMSVE